MAERAGEDALRLSKRPEPGSLVESSQGAIMVIRRGRVKSLVPGSYRAGAGLCRRQR
jgi:hypothetical protein